MGGLYFDSATSTVSDDTPINKFYKSRETRSRPPTDYNRTTVYDFDEWSKAHYGQTFQKTLRYRQRENLRKRREKVLEEGVKVEQMVFLIGLCVLLAMYAFYNEDYDNPRNIAGFGDTIIEKSPKSDRR